MSGGPDKEEEVPGEPPRTRRKSLCLDTELTLNPDKEELVSVALKETWKEDSKISLHPDFKNSDLVFLDGKVGEGGSHVKITFKNTGCEAVSLQGSEKILVISENPEGDSSKDVEDVDELLKEDVEEKGDEQENSEEDLKNKHTLETPMETEASTEEEKTDESKTDSTEGKKSDESKTDENPIDKSNSEEKSTEESIINSEDNEKETSPNKTSESTPPPFRDETQSTPEKGSDPSPDQESEAVVEESKDTQDGEEGSRGADKSDDGEDQKIKKSDVIKMRFVNETVDESDKSDVPEDNKTDESMETENVEEPESKKIDVDKPSTPVLKLASFSTMGQNGIKCPEAKDTLGKSVEGHKEQTAQGACSQCSREVGSLHQAVVWETMQFCDENCLGLQQATMDHCSSCNKEVASSSLGKYCVRFGSDIKQFCSNVCLEDYKKGLKVCSYCQKDISGGEGFLAPIGDKGQFKDFCEQACLQKYEQIYLGKTPDPETLPCSVCKEVKLVEREVLRLSEVVKLCSDPCFSAFKFVNSVDTLQCDLCTKHFDVLVPKVFIYFDGLSKMFCSKPCQNVFVMQNRKIVPCAYCKVKKYNFDMIEKFPAGQTTGSHLYCSLNCLNLHNMQMSKLGPSTPGSFSPRPSALTTTPGTPTTPGPASATTPLPVISQVSSLAGQGVQTQQQQIQVQTQTVREVMKESHVLPAEQPTLKNKGLQTKPFMMTKGVSCRPHPCHKETQTEGLTQPTPIPIPVPIYVPTPCKMYNAPFPVPVPIPLPVPVPIFIPTTRNSMKGIQKIIKKILNKIPADPFEAELLALAGDVAGEKDSSDSESEPENDRDRSYDDMPMVAQPPPTDLETEMTAEKIVPKPLPISTPDPMDRQRMMQGYNQQKRKSGRDSEGDDPDDPDQTWRPRSMWDQQQQQRGGKQPQQRQRSSNRGRGGSPAVKRFRQDQSSVSSREQQAAIQAIQQQPKERPDANHHLKFTYGVNAWKHWVVGKNAELEKQRAQGKYQKAFETDILKLRADELNFTLCMFVKEVKKPNGDSYAADSVFYLVLGIQEYLFENSRIDNIFTDVYYDPFTSALHEVVKDFKLPVNELGYFVTRIEEEHLWESKQLGAHSPQVLLNTLVYFNTKYFQLKTVDQHLKLSFSHIMKHWKKTAVPTKPGQQQRTVLLRYYPPPAKGQKPEERKMYEQHENHDNPLRCPVKLYEFYLSKCPESTKNRNDMFYLQPERSCVPDSPVWYSAQLLNRFFMEKMLSRLLMVREVQEHMLADQSG